MRKTYRRVPERIEAALPARLLWWCCKLMEKDETDDGGETCRALANAFDFVVSDQFRDLSDAENDKAWGRFLRVVNAAQEPLIADETHVGSVLVACRVIVQRVWNARCYEPDEVFLTAWGVMSDKVYDTCDNGRCLNLVEAGATAIAHAIVDRLHRDYGLWRDLERNERAAASQPVKEAA